MLLSLRFFFFNDTATTEIYTLSLHDALPISAFDEHHDACVGQTLLLDRTDRCDARERCVAVVGAAASEDRKSTRLNSSHSQISYAVFCLKKKKKTKPKHQQLPQAHHRYKSSS